jgi:hypothetical protein
MIFEIYGNTQFERELLNNPDIMNLVMDETFAKNLYAALCNKIWVKDGEEFSASWRYAGGVVAHLRNVSGGLNEEYLDFYLSGHEGEVFPDVSDALCKLGWTSKDYAD